MNTYHLLLERSWQYDCIITYDGHQNIYTSWKNRQKIILAPMTKEDLLTPKPETSINLLIITLAEIIGFFKLEDEFFSAWGL